MPFYLFHIRLLTELIKLKSFTLKSTLHLEKMFPNIESLHLIVSLLLLNFRAVLINIRMMLLKLGLIQSKTLMCQYKAVQKK